MRVARVKRGHVVRCLVYSFDIGAWIGIVSGVAALLSIWILPRVLHALTPYRLLLASGAAIVLVVLRLCIAYRNYLRFDHPFWTVLSSQVIVFLLLAATLVWRYFRRGGGWAMLKLMNEPIEAGQHAHHGAHAH